MFYVYEHWRPDTNTCFYVGKGSRYRANSVDRPHNRRHAFVVAKLATNGLKVEVRFVCRDMSENDAFAMERERIAYWRSVGASLVNKTDGGDGPSGFRHSDEAKEKIRAAHLGRKRSAETCARIGDATRGKNIGKKATDETRAKMSAAQKGRVVSPEVRAKISASHVGLSNGPLSDEHKAKIAAKSTGRKHYAETKAKMSANALARSSEHLEKIGAALRGKPLTDDHRAKLRESHLGHKPTEEARAAMRAAQRARGPRSPEHSAKIAAGLKAAHARRRANASQLDLGV